MRRAGWDVGQVARLMRGAGLHGVRRGRKPVTTYPTHVPDALPDLAERRFTAEQPNRLWVADITYVRILTGFCYVAFITDVCTRKIVGWAVSATLHTDGLPLLALEHALLISGAVRSQSGLIHHSDRGAQYVSLAYSDALITAGVTASVGSVGDSYDNALAETVNGLFKAELIHSQRIWESTQAVEIATMGWVHWWNTERLHEALGYRTPVEVEASYTHPTTTAPAPVQPRNETQGASPGWWGQARRRPCFPARSAPESVPAVSVGGAQRATALSTYSGVGQHPVRARAFGGQVVGRLASSLAVAASKYSASTRIS